MAIELKIERYCDGCAAFSPVKKEYVLFSDTEDWNSIKQTYVECSNKSLCNHISRKLEKYIRQQIEEENRLNDESRTETDGERKEES